MSYIRPTFVAEREGPGTWVDGKSQDDGHWEDCAPCSVLMAVRAATGNAKPAAATLDEAERLRQAAGYGPLNGTDTFVLARTATARYGVEFTRVSGVNAVWAALKPGKGAAVSGYAGNLPAGHKLRRHQPNFTGAHAIYVQREDASDRVWWMDPLGPQSGYTGDWANKADLLAFLNGIATATVVTLKPAPAKPPRYAISVAPNARVRIATVVPDGRISGWTERQWPAVASTASCQAPVTKAGTIAGSARVAFVTEGAFKGQWVEIANGVSVLKSK